MLCKTAVDVLNDADVSAS